MSRMDVCSVTFLLCWRESPAAICCWGNLASNVGWHLARSEEHSICLAFQETNKSNSITARTLDTSSPLMRCAHRWLNIIGSLLRCCSLHFCQVCKTDRKSAAANGAGVSFMRPLPFLESFIASLSRVGVQRETLLWHFNIYTRRPELALREIELLWINLQITRVEAQFNWRAQSPGKCRMNDGNFFFKHKTILCGL